MTRGLKIGVLASGRGSNLQAIMDAARDGKIVSRVVCVVSDKPGSGAVERARKAGIAAEVVEPGAETKGEKRAAHEARILKVLRHYGVELVVLAGYMRIVGPTLLDAFPDRIINIHPALLPAFPGLHAQRQALDAGAKKAGCTTHIVDAQTDHGPILLQASIPVLASDTEDTLSARILRLEHQLLPRTIHLLESDRIHIQGTRVKIDADESWATRYPRVPDAAYGEGY